MTGGSTLRARTVRHGIRLLARATPWLESEMLGLRQFVRPGDHCLDIGAAAGLYTAELAHLVGPTGLVHSIEPLPFAHQKSSRLLGLKNGRNVRCHVLALGDAAGTYQMSVPLRRGRTVTGRSFLTAGALGQGSNIEFDGHREVAVQAETLQAFCERLELRRVDFVKADAEGAELAILRGGAEMIAKFRPRMLIEIEDRHMSRYGHTSKEIVAWLNDRGYGMRVWSGGAWTAVPEVTTAHRNYLFVP